MHKTVAIVGLGIGKLYVDVCKSIGWNVITVDINPDANADFLYIEDALRNIHVDMGIVCTPNFTHETVAEIMAKHGVATIVVEKPGFADVQRWISFYETYPNSKLFMVKNNQHRIIFDSIDTSNIKALQLFWVNQNRIPGAGSWFTNKKLAGGGVSRDLMPHLLSVAQRITNQPLQNIHATCYQQYDMDTVTNESSYGQFHANGIYDVDDCAIVFAESNGIDIQCISTWKYDTDSDVVKWKFHMKSGEVFDFISGLCPESAYNSMLQEYMFADDATYKKHQAYDTEIHLILENFTESIQTVTQIKNIIY